MVVRIDPALVLLLEARARRVRPAGAGRLGDRRLQHVARAGDHRDVRAGEGNLVARLHHRVRGLADQFRIHLREGGDVRSIQFDRVAVIVEMLDRNPFGQFRHAAVVVAVIVGEKQVVDLLHARELEHSEDAAEIAFARVARVDQQRLARWRNIKGRLTALRINEIDIERLGVCRALCGQDGRGKHHHHGNRQES